MKPVTSAIGYVLAPKRLGVFAARAVYYAPSAALVLQQRLSGWTRVLAAFVVFEVGFGAVRHVLNDLHDVDGDRARGGHWTRFVTRGNAALVRTLVAVKLALSFVVALALSPALAALGALFVASQAFYDRVAKRRGALLSAAVVAFGYALRAASLFCVASSLPPSARPAAAALVVACFVYALHQTIDWRHAEAHFLLAHERALKPGTLSFARLPPWSLQLTRSCAALAAIVAACSLMDGVRVGAVAAVASAPIACLAVISDERLIALGRSTRLFAIVVWAALVVPEANLRVAALVLVVPFAIEYESRVLRARSSAGLFAGFARKTA